jgi:hypothetical protein
VTLVVDVSGGHRDADLAEISHLADDLLSLTRPRLQSNLGYPEERYRLHGDQNDSRLTGKPGEGQALGVGGGQFTDADVLKSYDVGVR